MNAFQQMRLMKAYPLFFVDGKPATLEAHDLIDTYDQALLLHKQWLCNMSHDELAKQTELRYIYVTFSSLRTFRIFTLPF